MAKQIQDQDILKIISGETIRDQGQLLAKIKEAGFVMTQSNLSKRLKKLEIKKKHGVYTPPTTVDINIKGLLKRIDLSPPNLVVLHTLPGHAHALAYQLDYASFNDPDSISSSAGDGDTGFPEIIGTVAGDDTVIVVVVPGQGEMLKVKLQDLLK